MAEPEWKPEHLERLEDLAGQVFRHVQARMEEERGVSPSQFYLLRLLEQRGVMTVSELAGRLGMSAAGATGLIDRLVKASLVTRQRDEHDRRIVWVGLSEEGIGRLQETRKLRHKVVAEVVAPLSAPEMEQMLLMFQKMADTMTKHRKGDQNCG